MMFFSFTITVAARFSDNSMNIKFNPDISRYQTKYLNRFSRMSVKKRVSKTVQAAFVLLGMYTAANMYENSYYKLNRDGIVNYIEPAEKQFDTREEAFDYARARITGALNSDKPYEHLVNISNANNEILAEFKGDCKEVRSALSLIDLMKVIWQGEGYTTLHGHPENGNGLTNPVGFNDFSALVKNEHNTEVIAFNKKGEISCLRKTGKYSQLSEEQLKEINEEIINILSMSLKKTQPVLYKRIVETYLQTKDSDLKKQLSQKFDSLLIQQDTTVYANRVLHDFWKKIAPKIGLEYFTNFSNNKSKN